ncbi:MAG: AsmA family protein [Alphaproteobacteria bacterium]
MRALRKIVIAIVVLIVVIVVGVVIAVQTIDVNAYRGKIAEEAQKATGRALTIKGDLKLKVFTLTPSVSVADVTFANAPWGSRPEMVKLKSFGAEVELMPLLSREIRVRRLVLDGADILLETDKQGRGNWVFEETGKSQPAAPSGGGKGGEGGALPVVNDVVVKDLALTFRDGRTGQQTTVKLERFNASTKSSTSPLAVALVGSLNGQAVTVDGKLDPVAELIDGKKPYAMALDAKVGQSHVIADLTAQLKATPLRVAGKINAPVINVKELTSLSGAPAEKGKDGGKAAGGGSKSGGSNRLFSDDPIDLKSLHAAEADLDLQADQIITQDITLEKLAGKVALHGGKLSLKPLSVQVAGSALHLDLVADGSGAKPAIDLALKSNKVDVGALLATFGTEKIIEGNADVDVELAGSGGSAHAIASSLGGKTSIVMNEGRINNKALKLVSADLMKVIDPWSPKEDTTKLNCLVSKFDVKGGTATSQALVIDSSAFTIAGGGHIDLGPETLNMIIDPRPKNQSLMNLAVPIKITGPILDPSYTPDAAALAKGALGAAGAVAGASGGAISGVLGALAGAAGGQESAKPGENPCVTASQAKPAAQEAPAQQKSGVGKALEGVGKGIKDLFKK